VKNGSRYQGDEEQNPLPEPERTDDRIPLLVDRSTKICAMSAALDHNDPPRAIGVITKPGLTAMTSGLSRPESLAIPCANKRQEIARMTPFGLTNFAADSIHSAGLVKSVLKPTAKHELVL
jgi:hypothetical protein